MYEARIKKLRALAKDEGIAVHEKSVVAFKNFAPRLKQKGALFLKDTGTLRIVLKEDKNLLGIEFFGGDLVEYVMFRDEGTTKRSAARCKISKLPKFNMFINPPKTKQPTKPRKTK